MEISDLIIDEYSYKDEIGQLYHSFFNMLQGQKDIIKQVTMAANKLNLSSSQFSEIAHKTSDTSQSQSYAMVELTKAIEDIRCIHQRCYRKYFGYFKKH